MKLGSEIIAKSELNNFPVRERRREIQGLSRADSKVPCTLNGGAKPCANDVVDPGKVNSVRNVKSSNRE
jgi:hypothetical protein